MVMDCPRLLVVDDDPYIRMVLKTLFSQRGWQVALAGTQAEGLASLDPAPQCVLLDLDLPDGRGEAILWEIRTHLPRTRVAICSGMEDPSRLELLRKLSPDLMLWKPIEMAPLYQLCEAARGAMV